MHTQSNIFVSYRRQDSRHATARIVEFLSDRIGADSLFLDVTNIAAGQDFVAAIQQRISVSDAALVIIGDNWLAPDENGQIRLHDPQDYVRREIATALAADMPVIPVLLDSAQLPAMDALPKDLQPLVNRNALRVEHETFQSDLENLVDALEQRMHDLRHHDTNQSARLFGWFGLTRITSKLKNVGLLPPRVRFQTVPLFRDLWGWLAALAMPISIVSLLFCFGYLQKIGWNTRVLEILSLFAFTLIPPFISTVAWRARVSARRSPSKVLCFLALVWLVIFPAGVLWSYTVVLGNL
ncbi:MAG: toll/interleukin-1 receptor domain-containing protein [Roseobacter sp.]